MEPRSASAATTTAGVLWGRDDEIAEVERLAQGADASRRSLVVTGEPGIGKSSLWARGVAAARRRGARVLTTTCVQAETDMPYIGLEDIVGDLLDEHGAHLPVPQREALSSAFRRGTTTVPTDPRTVAAATLGLLRHALELGPVLVAVDDVQWIDAETDACLASALRRLGSTSPAVLLTVRERSPLWEPSGQSEALVSTTLPAASTVRLGPLSERAVAALLRDRLGSGWSAEESRRVTRATGGNPFWALELTAAGRERTAAPGSLSLDRLVAERFGDLAPDVLHAACLVAALGRPRTATVTHALAVDGDVSAEEMLDRAVTAGLLRQDQGRLSASHPLIGTALLAWPPPFRRRRLHLQAANLVDSPEARATHLTQAANVVDSGLDDDASRRDLLGALDAARVAARQRGAPAAAVRFAEQALALVGGSADRNGRVVDLAELHYVAGEPRSARELLGEVPLGDLDVDQLERAAPLLAQTTNEQEGPDAARAVVDALEVLPRGEPSTAVARRRRALISTLRADLQCGASGDRRDVARRAVAEVESAVAHRPLRRRALGALALALLDAGDPVDDVLGRLKALGLPEALDPGGGIDVEILDGMRRHLLVDLAGSEASFGGVVERHLVLGDTPTVVCAGALLAYVELLDGRPSAAAATLARVEDQVEPTSIEWSYLLLARGDLHLARGEHDAIDELLDRASSGDRSGRSARFATRLNGMLAWQRGEAERAAEALGEATRIAERDGVLDPHCRLEADARFADALIVLGEYAEAGRIADRLGTFARRHDDAVTSGQEQRLLAQLHARRDEDLDRAVAAAGRAVTLHEGCPHIAEHGISLLTLADLHELRGDTRTATEHRRGARAVFDGIGYTWWAARTAAALRPAMSRLSASERPVADLIVAGATNREVARTLHLSVRTVENHLTSVDRELGVRSRGQLAGQLADPGGSG